VSYLSGFVGDFNRPHGRVIGDRDEREHELPERVGLKVVERLGHGAVFAARLLEDVKIAEQGNTVTVDIEKPAP
jgi:hypothetical protein